MQRSGRASATPRITRRRAIVAALAAGATLAGAGLGVGLGASRGRAARTLPGAAGTAPASATPAPALTLEQSIGQLFMVGLRSGAGTAETAQTNDAIQTHHAGSVVLFGSGWSSAAAVQAAIAPLQGLARAANAGLGLLVSGNQEGGEQGSFQAFYGDGFATIPSALAQAAGDPSQLQAQAQTWGGQLLAAGINLNLAPVLDTVPAGTASANDAIGRWDRQYGSDPSVVATYGVAFARGMRAAKIAVAIKHFPGLGRVTGNTDFTTEGIVDSAFSGAADPYLQPYKAGIDAGADLVMVSLATYPQVDTAPAVFSSAIMRDLLRGDLGFQKPIISDDLGAAAAVAGQSPAQRALDFLRAGGDIVLTVQAADIPGMTQAVVEVAQTDAAFAAQLNQSLQRVLQLKMGLGLGPN